MEISGMISGTAASPNVLSILTVIMSVAVVGALVYKMSRRDEGIRKFYIGKAMGTIVVFTILGIYLLLRYVFNLI